MSPQIREVMWGPALPTWKGRSKTTSNCRKGDFVYRNLRSPLKLLEKASSARMQDTRSMCQRLLFLHTYDNFKMTLRKQSHSGLYQKE